MEPKKEKELFEKYPKLFRQKDLPMSQTCLCWGAECGSGWYDLIDTMCSTIENHCKNAKLKCEFVQIKEKFGRLRVYEEGGDDFIRGVISMAEHISGRICERCGNPGMITKQGGWLRCECFNCCAERTNEDNDTNNR